MVKPMVEKSPNALKLLTRARRSWISGTENVVFSTPMPLRALADVDQPVLVAIDQRPQQNPAHQGEDRGVRPDAQRQRQHHGYRQPFGTHQRAHRVFQLTEEVH